MTSNIANRVNISLFTCFWKPPTYEDFLHNGEMIPKQFLYNGQYINLREYLKTQDEDSVMIGFYKLMDWRYKQKNWCYSGIELIDGKPVPTTKNNFEIVGKKLKYISTHQLIDIEDLNAYFKYTGLVPKGFEKKIKAEKVGLFKTIKTEKWYYKDIEVNINNIVHLNNNVLFNVNGKLHYYLDGKLIPVDELIQMIEDGLTPPIGFFRVPKDGKLQWEYGYERIDKRVKFTEPRIVYQNGNLFYKPKDEQFVEWEEFKNSNSEKVYNRQIKQVLKLNPSAFIQPTFIDKESDNWVGAKTAFEFSLLEHKVKKFVYVMLDKKMNIRKIDQDEGFLQNYKGSNVDFVDGISKDTNWYKGQIIIIPIEHDDEVGSIIDSIKLI
jgi:hypothetical protein